MARPTSTNKTIAKKTAARKTAARKTAAQRSRRTGRRTQDLSATVQWLAIAAVVTLLIVAAFAFV